MPKLVSPGSEGARIVAEEIALLARVEAFLISREVGQKVTSDHDAELIELRDAIAEAKPEDVASLVEQMMRVSAVAAGRRGKVAGPIDKEAPYFGHLRLLSQSGPKARDVLIGRRGIIDRTAGVQIVDWRDAPISQLYYRYDEGDDYEEEISGSKLSGIIEVRRNVTITGGRLRRIGCPQGNYFCDAKNQWWEAERQNLPALRGGQGLAARAPRQVVPDKHKGKPGRPGQPLQKQRLGGETPSFAVRSDKHLPEIAALIDPDQFSLITEQKGLLVIQGGAGSGKTTVALHRVAYLTYADSNRFRPKHMLVVVPSEALARYVSGVLPSLGVKGVSVQTTQTFFHRERKRLLPHLPPQENDDPPEGIVRLKKHPAMLPILAAYVEDQVRATEHELKQGLLSMDEGEKAAEILSAKFASLRSEPLYQRCRKVRELVRSGNLGLSPNVALRADEVLRRLTRRAHDVGRDWAEVLTDKQRLVEGFAGDRTHGRVSEDDIRDLIAYCQAQQEEVEPLSDEADEERYQAVDGKPLDEDHPQGKLDRQDSVLLLWLYHLKHGGLPTKDNGQLAYDHLVLDEAQDLSVLETKLLLSLVHEGKHGEISATIAGDVAQRLVFDNGFCGWEDLLSAVGITAVKVSKLRLLYRSTLEVMRLAREVLGPLASPETEQEATRSGAEVVAFRFAEAGESVAFLAEALRSLLSREPTASVALIGRHAGTADLYYQSLKRAEVPSLRRVVHNEFQFTPGVDVTDVTQVKGLEFDYVVLIDATEASYPDAVEARHLLHIAITRCAHQLWLLCAAQPSPLIPERYFNQDIGISEEEAGALQRGEDPMEHQVSP